MQNKTRKRIFAIGLLLGLVYLLWPFVVGGRQMQDFCQALPPHAPLADVRQAISQQGYRLTLLQDGNGTIHDSRSFGRFTCQVQFTDGKLASARYTFND